MASMASAISAFLDRPPEYSSPLPMRMKLSTRKSRPISARLSSLTTWDLDLGHVTFALVRKGGYQVLAHDQTQDRVTEELEFFVVVDLAGLFVGEGAVRKSKVQEREALEPYLSVFLKKLQLLFAFSTGHRSCEG